MRLRVDPAKCEAFGFCAEIAPKSFQLDEWGYSRATPAEVVAPEEVAAAREAMRQCPEQAIRLLPPDEGAGMANAG